MKKRMALVIIVAMMVSIFALPAFAADPKDTAPIATSDVSNGTLVDTILWAGQTLDVGGILIDEIGDNEFLVTYKIDEPGWYLTQVHFEAISEGDMTFIANKGGIIPGQLTVNEEFVLEDEVTEYSFVYESGAVVTGFAAHAVVCHPAVYEDGVGTGHFTLFSGEGDGETLAWVHPNWNTAAGPEWLIGQGAEWIWKTYRTDEEPNPTACIDGDIWDFDRTFSVPGIPTLAELRITADNGYAFSLNDSGQLGSAQLYGSWLTSDLTQSYVDSDGWQTREYYNVLNNIQEGDNTLYITGVNEYMGPDDGQALGTGDSNPAGVLYKLKVQYRALLEEEGCETAWGEGNRVGKSWSMIIPID